MTESKFKNSVYALSLQKFLDEELGFEESLDLENGFQNLGTIALKDCMTVCMYHALIRFEGSYRIWRKIETDLGMFWFNFGIYESFGD